jgi:hypothetical protein
VKRSLRLGLVALALGLAPAAWAHKESDSYLRLNAEPGELQHLRGQWDIALRDLAFVLPLDANGDGAITWGELKAQRQAIERYALPHLSVRGDGIACTLAARDLAVAEHSDGAYAALLLGVDCDKTVPQRLSLTYDLFADVDPYHRGIVTLALHGQTVNAVLGPQQPSLSVDFAHPQRWRQFLSFVRDGVLHIWTGPDHLLFIASLLLPAVLICRRRPRGWRDGGEWQPVTGFWSAFWELVKIISGFTVSHSVTLTAAVLGYVNLPSRLVESGIAASVLLAALNNLYPLVTRRAWLVAFGFGFIHGLGFASALAGLDLPAGAMALALGGFNVGVELGQESVVLPLLALAFLIRRTRFYREGVLRYGSAAIVALAGLWLCQRALDLSMPALAFLTPG